MRYVSRVAQVIALVYLTTHCSQIYVSGPRPIPPKDPKIYSSVTEISSPIVTPLYWGKWVKAADYTQDCVGSESTPTQCVHIAEKIYYVLPKEVLSCDGLSAEDALGVFNWSCSVEGSRVYFRISSIKTAKGLRDLINFSTLEFKKNSLIVTGFYDPEAPSVSVSSLESVWFYNPIAQLSSNSGGSAQSLSGYAAGTILVIPSSMNTGGFTIAQDNLIITMPKSVSLTWSGTYAGAFFYSNGYNFNWIEAGTLTTTSSSTKATYGLDFTNQKFLTISDATIYSATTAGIHIKSAKNSRLGLYTGSDPEQVALKAVNCATGIYIEHDRTTGTTTVFTPSTYNIIGTLEATGSSGTGIIIEGTYLTVNNLISTNNSSQGIQLDVVSYSTFGRMRTFNNGATGLRPRAFNYNKVRSVESVSNSSSTWAVMGHGMTGNVFQEYFVSINSEAIAMVCAPGSDTNYGCGASYNIFNNVTLINTKNNGYWAAIAGIDSSSSNNNIFSNVFISNVDAGLSTHNVGSSTQNSYINLAVYNSNYASYYMNSSYTLHLSGVFVAGGIATSRCTTTAATYSPNCTQSGTDNSTDFKSNGLSNATFRIDSAFTNTNVFKGDTGNLRLSSDVTNWNPSTPFQYWLNSGTLFSSSTYGKCTSSNLCNIYDIRLSALSSYILNKGSSAIEYNSITPNSTGDNSFTANTTCPTEVRGDQYGTTHPFNYSSSAIYSWYHNGDLYEVIGDSLGDDDGTCESSEPCQSYFLRNAREITNDSTGDNDGLCESNEACIYSPNFGAYQGEGELESCTYVQSSDAKAIRNVTMYGYSTNGI